MNDVELLGYSERGILNALLYEIYYADNGDCLLRELLAEARFLFTEDKPPPGSATIFVEQSLAQFGDADAIIVIESDAGKCVVFGEAKVGSNYFLSKEFTKFSDGVEEDCMPTGFSSNIFTQIYHKQKFIRHTMEELQKGVHFPPWSFTKNSQENEVSTRKIGNNQVVLDVANTIKENCEKAFYLMLIPECDDNAEKFFFDTLKKAELGTVPHWDNSHVGFLTWKKVKCFCQENKLKNTLAVFEHNGDQIYNRETKQP